MPAEVHLERDLPSPTAMKTQKTMAACLTICLTAFALSASTFLPVAAGASQSPATAPFSVRIQEIASPATPALQSFVVGESNGKWVLIGGRTNGLHGFVKHKAFPFTDANAIIYVYDPVANQIWNSGGAQLPDRIADALSSTNMESYQTGNTLYIVGGYGLDTGSGKMVTFSTLTAVDVEGLAQAIVAGKKKIKQYFRQITDSRLQVTGGEMERIGNTYYLVFGQVFTGKYADPLPPDTVQRYTEQIRQFQIVDDGTHLSLANYSAATDPANYHRRDLNVVPTVAPDGSFGITAYGGVFTQAGLPFLNPVDINSSGAVLNTNYSQSMNQYTCANAGLFDSATGSMNTIFFGGISLNFFDPSSGTIKQDIQVPFIQDITVVTRFADGTSSQSLTAARFSTLLGASSHFILNPSVPHFDNGVIQLRNLTGETLIGYVYGGMEATVPNFGNSQAVNKVFQVFVTPN